MGLNIIVRIGLRGILMIIWSPKIALIIIEAPMLVLEVLGSWLVSSDVCGNRTSQTLNPKPHETLHPPPPIKDNSTR